MDASVRYDGTSSAMQNYYNSVINSLSGMYLPTNSSRRVQTAVSPSQASSVNIRQANDLFSDVARRINTVASQAGVKMDNAVEHAQNSDFGNVSAMDWLKKQGSSVSSVLKDVGSTLLSSASSSGNKSLSVSSGSAQGVAAPYTPVTSPNYIDAPLAEAYGMSAQTAYEEALANTAHQREMRDFQKAGLNPVLAAHYSGSGVFTPQSMVTQASSGSSGGHSSAKSSSSPADEILKFAGGVTTLITGKSALGKAVQEVGSSLISFLS